MKPDHEEFNMITLTCDKCDKPFETEEDAAGGKVECPYCGDINRVPAALAAPVARKGVASSGAPAAGASPESESIIMIVRQAMFRAHPFLYSLMMLTLLGGIILAGAAVTMQQFATARWWMWVGVGVALAGGLWWLIWWAAPHRWIKLTITNRRTIRQEGIIVRKTSEVLHDHIRNVKIEQSVTQRLLGVGSIWIDSAGGTKDQSVEIEMHHVARPYAVKEIIDKYRRM